MNTLLLSSSVCVAQKLCTETNFCLDFKQSARQFVKLSSKKQIYKPKASTERENIDMKIK